MPPTRNGCMWHITLSSRIRKSIPGSADVAEVWPATGCTRMQWRHHGTRLKESSPVMTRMHRPLKSFMIRDTAFVRSINVQQRTHATSKLHSAYM